LEAGLTPAYCAKQLGHSVAMFLSVYADWVDQAATDREMARLEAVIGPPRDKKEQAVSEETVAMQ
jgi:integrase